MAVEWGSRVIFESFSAVSEIFWLLKWVISTYLHLYIVQVASIDLASVSDLVALANILGDFFGGREQSVTSECLLP